MATTTVTRELSDVNTQVKLISTQLRYASQACVSFSKALAVDPNNVETLGKYQESLNDKIKLTSNYLEEMQAKLELMPTETEKQQRAYAEVEGKITATKAQLTQYEAELKKTTTQTEKLTDQNKGIDEMAEKFGTVKTVVSEIKSVVNDLTSSLKSMFNWVEETTTEFADTAWNITSLIQKYGGTAEEWQTNAWVWDQITASSDVYESVLSSIASTLGQVEKGSSRWATYLELVGLTFDDLEGKTTSEALEILMNALASIEDEATRSATATALFGETTGSYLCQMLDASSDSIQHYIDLLEDSGYMTNEQVANGTSLHDTYDSINQTLSTMTAILGESLIPLVEDFSGALQNVLPVVEKIGDALSAVGTAGIVAIGIAAALISTLPSLITMMAALNFAMGWNTTGAMTALAILGAAGVATIAGVAGYGLTHSGSSDSAVATSANAVEESVASVSSASEARRSESNGSSTTTVYGDDNATYNITISSEVDADEFIKKLTKKKRSLIGG